MATLAVMGCDPHLDTIAVAVLARDGVTFVAETTMTNTAEGWAEILELCHTHRVAVVGIEGASGYGRSLAETLVNSAVVVKEVPTRVTAATRLGEGTGKNDPIDARTIARAVAGGKGAVWNHDPDLETIRRFSGRRETLVRQQTAAINALKALIAEVDPAYAATQKRIRSIKQFNAIAEHRYVDDEVAWLILDLVGECIKRHRSIGGLERRITQALPPVGHTLMRIPGCGPITAGWILGQLAGTDHFATSAKFAAYTGAAPLDASSGRQQRHRFNRGGNRVLNRALHTIVLTQLQHNGQAALYINRRCSEGKTQREAMRACKRHLARRIWKILNQHGYTPQPELT